MALRTQLHSELNSRSAELRPGRAEGAASCLRVFAASRLLMDFVIIEFFLVAPASEPTARKSDQLHTFSVKVVGLRTNLCEGTGLELLPLVSREAVNNSWSTNQGDSASSSDETSSANGDSLFSMFSGPDLVAAVKQRRWVLH